MADFLFTEFSTQNINSNTDIIHTSGRSTRGIAPARYVSDDLATAALFAAHPRFVGRTSNGRHFRAVPINGAIEVELAGALGDGLSNDQPAIQATIDYAEAIGARTIVFAAKAYRLHCPIRTSDPAGQIGQHLYDGRPIVISTALILRSVRHGGSRLVFRHHDGSERQGNWQTVMSPSTGQMMLWRGGAIFVKCPDSAPIDYADRPGVTLIDIELDGGIPRGSVYEWPARISDGEGWDATDKGIEIEPDRFSGDIRLIRSKVTGFRGELIYQAGIRNGRIQIRSAVLGETNGVLMQTGGTALDIDGLLGYRGFSTFEGWSGRHGQMVNAVFEDCIRTGGMAGGKVSAAANRNTPQRFSDDEVPWLHLDAEFRNCGPVMFGSWVRGHIRITDSQLVLDGAQVYGEGLHDLDLEVISQVDKLSDYAAVLLLGSATPGKQTLSNVRIRLRCGRTADAQANGRVHMQPVDYRGSFGTGVVIEHSSGDALRPSGPSGKALTSVPDNFPCFRNNRWFRTAMNWGATSQNIESSPQIVVRGDLMAVTASSPGTWPMMLPTIGIQHGHELAIRNNSGAGIFASLAAGGSGAALPANRVVAPGQWIILRFDREFGLWREVQPPLPLSASAALAIAPIPSGDVSPEYAIACPGASHGMTASITPAASLASDFEISGQRALPGIVAFRLRNHGPIPAAPPQQIWTAKAG